MRDILCGEIPYLLSDKVEFVKVPFYNELSPERIIADWKLEKFKLIKCFCPELNDCSVPRDRAFFFNVLNTLKPGEVSKLVLHAET